LLPPERYRLLEKTYAGANIAENWTTLFDTIALFRDVANEVAEALAFRYPVVLDGRVTDYLRRINAEGEQS